jgi:nonspecific dipeptidase
MLQQLCSILEKNTKRYISHLSEAVAIPSISADLKNHLDDIVHMMQYTCDHIHRLGGTSKLMDNPKSTDFRPLPPILLAEFISDPDKKTVCVYGHLDVQPASKSDGWKTDPFVLTEKDGQLFGRGATDDKGPILAWLAVVEAYMSLEGGLPVNLKFILEGMEVSYSYFYLD